jgi:DNA-directed RNA polymerase specialized sigma24 family protein
MNLGVARKTASIRRRSTETAPLCIDPTGGMVVSEPDNPERDWDQIRKALSRTLARKLFRVDRATLDDLTSEAVIRLLHATRRGAIHNIDGLMETIAQRTVVDFLRRRRLGEGPGGIDVHDDPDNPLLPMTPTDDEWPLSRDRVEFVVLEFFESQNSGCLILARHFFVEHNWLEVARITGRTHTAILKQWSRCLELLRKTARSDAGFGWEWA